MCQSSSLLPGVQLVGTCEGREREVCDARCDQNGMTLWQKRIQCLNGKWTRMPYCEGASVVRSLEIVSCDTLPVKVEKKTLCLKITEKFRRDKRCPDLLTLKLNVQNCSRKPYSSCKVSCGEAYVTLVCMPNGEWSHIPKCETIPLKVCAVPKAGKILNCSFKEGENCKLQCPDGKIIDEEITCLASGEWSFVSSNKRSIEKNKSHSQNILSKCPCPPPRLNGEMITAEDCSKKKIQETCHLSCKKHFAIIGSNTIICQKDLSWSPFPECSDKTCPVPWLDDPLAFEEDCASKLNGETCKLRCEGHSELVQKEPFRCINGTQWTTLPHCVCRPPILPDNVYTKEDCTNKLVGETCQLKCKQKFSVPRKNFIICQTNGTWTSIPSCEIDICIKPDLPRTAVVTKEDCSYKRIGETCTLECLKVPETYEIICLNTTLWSPYPKCSCPSFISSKTVQFEEDCSGKKPGEKCRISCKNNPTLNKQLFITCLTNSEWSNEPLCDELVCPTPALPRNLIFGQSSLKKRSENIYIRNETGLQQYAYQDCKEKTVGSTCEVSCKNGGSLIGPNIIVCLNTLKWSAFPSCACAEPQISEGLQLTMNCRNILPGSECKLKCEEHLELIGNSFIRCLENLTWSRLPTCSSGSCSYPQVPERISIAEVCINKNPGDTCKIACKYGGTLLGSDVIICLNKTHWSDAPLCTCPKPILNTNVKFVTECDSVLPGNECKLACENNVEISDRSAIICGNDSKWSGLQPECKKNLCQKPPLGPLLTDDDSCSSKEPGEVCTLSCKGGGIITGNATIKCLNPTTWSKIPDCGCPEPVLSRDIESIGNCSNKIIGSKCNLKCKKGKMVGNPYITCEENANWSRLPVCRLRLCHKPNLPVGILEPVEDCSAKEVGDKCSLRCIEGGKIIGPNFIECLSESKWSKYPNCTCPDPKHYLPENLMLEEDCGDKSSEMQCKLSCKGSMKLIGNNFIKCEENTKWSKLPRCETVYCPEPNLEKDVLISLKDCRFKTANETCELACKKGGKLIGDKFITCLNGIKWSAYPKCTCKAPVLKEDLVFAVGEDCSFKEPGMICKLSCKNGKKLPKIDFIICQNDTEWSPSPKCQEAFCPKPVIPSYLTTLKDCSSTEVDRNCELNCTGGRKIVGQNYMTCLSNLTWSPIPQCTCPPLYPTGNMNGNCDFVIPGANCNITCKHPMATAQRNFIVCTNESNWDNLFICKRMPCKNIGFPSSSSYIGRCENKVAGELCKLRCRGRGVFIDNINTITCTKDGQWTKPRQCVCQSITSIKHLGLELKEPCTNKNPNEICRIECINGLDLKDRNFIRCDASFRWSPPPSCEADFCPAPHLPEGMKIIEGNCSRLKIGASCKLKCVNGGLINGSGEPYTLVCNRDRKLNKIPTCTCSRPSIPATLSSPETCEEKEVNDVCLVRCNSDPNIDRYIVCLMQEKWMWSGFPDCPCIPPTHLNTYVTLEEACVRSNFPVNTTCNVSCGNFGSLVGPHYVSCLPGSIWSESPSCTCAPPPPPPPQTSGRYLDLSQCKRVLPGMSCPVSCIKGIIDRNFLHCNASFFWQDYPTCEVKCDNPRDMLAENFVALYEDCAKRSEFPSGLICNLRCLNGGVYISPPAIQCTDNATWNSSAHCTCPKPEISGQDFAFAENEKDECKNKYKGQECNFVCSSPGYAIKPDKKSLECEGKLWKGELVCERVGNWCPNPTNELRAKQLRLANGCSKEATLPPTTTCVVECMIEETVMMIPGQSISADIVKSEIRCSTSGTWLNIPICSCYTLRPQSPYLLRENCDKKFPGQKCLLSLVEGFTFQDVDYVQCINGIWGNMPAYKALPKCSKPNINDALLLWPPECNDKFINQTCDLQCRHNAFFMTTQLTTFRITCVQVPTGQAVWSAFPLCACMNFFHVHYKPKDSCAHIRPGGPCIIFCMRENAWGHIICDSQGTWTIPPVCT